MDGFRIPLGDWVDEAVTWLRDNIKGFFDFIAFIVRWMVDGLTDVLVAIPVPLAILLFVLIGWLLRSWQMALGTALTFTLVVAMDLWEPTLQTLSLVLVATVIALLMAIPLGIWSARNDTVRVIVKPILDFMQTMPTFAYLVPILVLFGLGPVVSVVASAMPIENPSSVTDGWFGRTESSQSSTYEAASLTASRE